jgi:hypothetical protein
MPSSGLANVYACSRPDLVHSAGVIVGDRDVIVIDSLTNAADPEPEGGTVE